MPPLFASSLPSLPNFWYSTGQDDPRSKMENYQKMEKIGEGQFYCLRTQDPPAEQ